jgi:hypothetical protein
MDQINPELAIDIEIAERVLGLKVQKNKSGSKLGGYYYTIGEPDWYDFQGDMQLQNAVPNYCEDLGSAFYIVEHLGGTFTLTTNRPLHSTDKTNQWYCSFDGGLTYASAATAPLAICRAAIAFKGAP